MLDTLATLVKLFLIPGSLSFLLAGVTLGVLLTLGRRPLRRLGLAGLSMLVLLYWMLTIPAVSDGLAGRFQSGLPQITAASLRDCDAIVVYGAGVSSLASNGQTLTIPDPQTAFNAFEGAHLYHLLAAPLPVVASGGVVDPKRQRQAESLVIRDILVQAGVPPERIILDSDSVTTHEQAVNIAALARRRGWKRIALITPPVQMPRAAGSLATQGLTSIVRVEAPFRADSGPDDQRPRWLPDLEALWISERAAYDYMGWAYYWLRGWLT